MNRYDFLLDTYDTERLKTLSVWTQVAEEDFEFRAEPRARTPREHMVHQCAGEDGWFKNLLGIDLGAPALPTPPDQETRPAFLRAYAEASGQRLACLHEKPEEWFAESVRFFDVERSRAWVLTRRIAHSAHHRGQLSALLRMRGVSLWSVYGPTADTGGLPGNGARTLYRYPDLDVLLEAAARGDGGDGDDGGGAVLPGPGEKSPTERRG